MNLRWLLVLLIFQATACKKVFYYSNANPSSAKSALTKDKGLTIDHSYEFFVRQVYEKDRQGTNDEKELATNLNAAGENNSKLIEVEYLFISKRDKKLVYISTMPDKRKKRYAGHYLGDQYVNAWDFKTFLFGSVQTGEETRFLSWNGKNSDHWQIEYSTGGSEVYINNIVEKIDSVFENQIPVREALHEKVYFRKVPNPQIVFHKKDSGRDTAILKDNTIYLVKKGKKHRLYFPFDRKVKDEFSTLFFGKGRIAYDPRELFKG